MARQLASGVLLFCVWVQKDGYVAIVGQAMTIS